MNVRYVVMKCWFAVLMCLAIPAGCSSAHRHYEDTHGTHERKSTVGVVQKEIRKGMPAADVVSILGSPNIVTTDEQGEEVWVYDKISTDVTYSRSDGYGTLLLLGAGGGSGAVSKTQRTLTVVIKFDGEKKVRDFAYHSSRF